MDANSPGDGRPGTLFRGQQPSAGATTAVTKGNAEQGVREYEENDDDGSGQRCDNDVWGATKPLVWDPMQLRRN